MTRFTTPAAAVLALLAASAAHADWIFTDLGVPTASNLNAAGEIVGNDGIAGAFVGRHFQRFQFLPGTQASAAFAVNAAGVAVGETQIAQPDDTGRYEAVVYTSGVPQVIPQLAGFPEQQANDINASGAVVGKAFGGLSNADLGPSAAFVYANGTVSALGTLNGGNFSNAVSINQAGDIVGTSGNFVAGTCADCSAFLFHDGVMTSLGTLPGTSGSNARQINDAGQVVGYATSTSSGLPVAFLVSGGHMKRIPDLPGSLSGVATGINNLGQVVGSSSNFRSGHAGFQSGFLYENGVLTDLSQLAAAKAAGFSKLTPTRINDLGQIVGTGTLGAHRVHSFLLTPTGTAAAVDRP